ncbi:MAG: NAD(P)/FAD-dependent oxidoreductase [Hyphomicrobiaceae bacterium]
MIENEAAVIADSLWSATANPTPDCPPLDGDAETRVAIIGAGFTGLSAALHLAERGIETAVLEAETPGWGASGRNGGQVNPGLIEDPDQIEEKFGAEMGARMVRMSGAAGDLVFSLIERHAISCDAVHSGWIRAAHNETALQALTSRVEQWQRRGGPLRLLSREETTQMIGTDVYCGGAIDPRGGNVHPLNYALGLADAAIAAGAKVHGNSRALGLEHEAGRYVLETADGRLTADKVLLCTNGYTDGLVPPLAQTVVPVRSTQVATTPLSDNLRASILPGLQAPSDTRRLLLYFRMDAAGRFIMGGRGTYGAHGTRRAQERLRAVTRDMFPQLADVEWQYAWGGFVAATADHYPHLNQMGDGIIAGLGYNGRGVAMATAMGKVMADWASGTPASELDFPMTPPKPIPFHGLHKLGVQATIAKYRALDWLGV